MKTEKVTNTPAPSSGDEALRTAGQTVAMRAVQRCNREIERIHREAAENHTHPAYLFALGVNDWTVERDLIAGQRLPGPSPTCQCGRCKTCRRRVARQRYYQQNAVAIIPKNVESKRRRRQPPEVSDEEMDRRALEMGGCGR